MAEFSPRLTDLGSGLNSRSFYVLRYIIFSKKLNKKYVGFTSDIKKRFLEHNLTNSGFTKAGKPWILIYYEAFMSKKSALREEKFLKSGKGKERIKYLLDDIGGIA